MGRRQTAWDILFAAARVSWEFRLPFDFNKLPVKLLAQMLEGLQVERFEGIW